MDSVHYFQLRPLSGISSSRSESALFALLISSVLQFTVSKPTMTSADFCHPILLPHGISSLRQDGRPPRVMRTTFPLIPATSTTAPSVQVLGFEDIGLLTRYGRLVCDFCSSGQCFAFGFLQIPPHGGHLCRSANCSPCRASSGLSPPSHPVATTTSGTAPVKALCTMPGTPIKKPAKKFAGFLEQKYF